MSLGYILGHFTTKVLWVKFPHTEAEGIAFGKTISTSTSWQYAVEDVASGGHFVAITTPWVVAVQNT